MPNTNFRNSHDFSGENFYVDIDVHKKSWRVAVRDFELEAADSTQPPAAEALASTLHRKFRQPKNTRLFPFGFG